MVRMEEFTDHKDTTVNSVQLCSLQFSSVLSFRSHVEMLHVTYTVKNVVRLAHQNCGTPLG